MSDGGDGAACVLVALSPAEYAALRDLPGHRAASADNFEALLASIPAAAVVVGSAAESPVAVAQRAYRLAPGAGVAVLTTPETHDEVRRQLAYAPGVPLDVLVLQAGDALAEQVTALLETALGRRRHQALLTAITTKAAALAEREPAPALVGLGALLEHAPLGVLVCDLAGQVLGWNRRAEEILSLGRDAAGGALDTLLPGANELVAGLAVGASRAGGTIEVTTAGDVEVELSAVASELDDGRRVALLLLVDVTARREAERTRDRLVGHVELLARVSEVLTTTLDAEQAVDLLAKSLVPALGDMVSIQLAGESGGIGLLTVQHRDPALASATASMRERRATAGWSPIALRANAGEPVLASHLRADDIKTHVGDSTMFELFQSLGVSSLIAVPLPGRDEVLGALLVATVRDGRTLTDDDLAVAVEVGRRAGIALDNARLYARQSQLASELQRSLLTDPPDPDHAEIVVRYVAAAEQSQVGGDWYDAFLQPDGGTVLVIGDVVGHDTRAAAAMGQLRGLVRGIAYTTNGDPADVLTRVDAAVEGLSLRTTATAVVARLEKTPAAEAHDRVWFHWSNAGHPPPIVVSPDGDIQVLGTGDGDLFAAEADLLLGIDPFTSRRDMRVALARGSTVLLYTDGLVERRGQSLDDGIRGLVSLLSESWRLPLDDLCDTALRRLLPEAPEDDVAIVAVRLHPEHAPAGDDDAGGAGGAAYDEELALPGVPASVAVARRFAVAACEGTGLGELCEIAALLVSEVATNAVRHGGGQVRVRVRAGGGDLRVEVTDDNDAPPAPRDSGEFDEGGRGLALVDALAAEWGWQPSRPGKTVWFTLRDE